MSNRVGILLAYKTLGLKVGQSGCNIGLRFHGPAIGIDFKF